MALALALTIGVSGATAHSQDLPPLNTGSQPGDAAELGAVQGAVQQHLSTIPGVAVAIVKPGDGDLPTTSTYYFGTADKAAGTAVGPETQFEIGSQTKTFTAALLAVRRDAGTSHLSDLAAQYVPDGVTLPTLSNRPITLADLVTHRSGLKDYPANLDPQDKAAYDVAMLWQGLQAPGALDFPPGLSWLYSDWGFGLLGSLMADADEAGTGQPPFDTVVRSTLTEPLGMADTYLEPADPASDQQLAVPYSDGAAAPYWNNTGALAGGGGLVSTARDMAVWAATTLGYGSGPLSATLPRMLDPIAPGQAGTDMTMGMAWQLYPAGNGIAAPYAWKNGTTAGTQSVTLLVPSTGWGVTVLTNGRDATPVDVARQLAAALAGAGAGEGSAANPFGS